MSLEELLKQNPYSMNREQKDLVLTKQLKELTEYHLINCEEYHRIMLAYKYDRKSVKHIEDIPFLPVRLFKEYNLKSYSHSKNVLTMTSSGTTGQKVSRITIDDETSKNQKKVLFHIVSDYIGQHRLPLLIIDSKKAIKDRKLFGARGSGILGFSILGKSVTYALDDCMEFDLDLIQDFAFKHRNEKILLFGYTFIIWEHFIKKLREQKIEIDFGANAVLFHGGGWKKLIDQAIDMNTFKQSIADCCHIGEVHDYYGMAEQLGSVYVECEYGHMHASNFSDIIIRNPFDFSACPHGDKGLIELVSVLPKSYPGHAILTEDEAMVLGEDDCPCGRKGKYFKLLGRVKNAELRGCSDTYADRYSRE